MPEIPKQELDEKTLKWIEGAMERLEEGQPEEALDLAQRACKRAPSAAAAWQICALARAALEDDEAAIEACDRCLELSPDDPETLLFAADLFIENLDSSRELLERGLDLARRGAELAGAAGDEELAAEHLLVQAWAHEQLGEMGDALARVEDAVRIAGATPELLVQRGTMLFDLCRFEQARQDFQAVLEDEPDEAAAHYGLALLDERKGDIEAAAARMRRARELSPDDFPEGIHLEPADFDQAVEEALEDLPEKVRKYLANVAVTVEDLPSDDDLLAADPPLSPQILGMFRGSPLGEQSVMDPWTHFPSAIVLYQKNLERFALDRDEIIEQIGITLLHEVGHFLGLDEEALEERGLG